MRVHRLYRKMYFYPLSVIFFLGCTSDIKQSTQSEKITSEDSKTMPSESISNSNNLQWIDSADAGIDLQEAIVKGDTRFIGIGGLVLEVPGLPEPEDYKKNYGLKIIDVETASDVDVKEHIRLTKKAREYAGKYNRLFLEYLKEKKSRK